MKAALAVLVALALLPLVLAAGGAVACTLPPDAGSVLGEGTLRLAWRAAPPTLAVARPFALHVSTCPGLRLVRVDATMPEHRHGMNYRPSLHADGDGRWRAEGLLWHMAGRWELRFDLVDAAGAQHVLRQTVELR